MPIKAKPGNGLLVPTNNYKRIKAFQGGSYYWEQQPQSIVRQYLGDYLPPVEATTDGPDSCGWFRRFIGDEELLWKSTAVGRRSIPAAQLVELEKCLDELRRVAISPETGPHNRQVIEGFRLPDPGVDPELYRLRGPPWARRLEILWGCEKSEDTSLPPSAALAALSKDRAYSLKRWLWLLLALVLLLLFLFLLNKCGTAIGKKAAIITNQAPTSTSSVAGQDEAARTLRLNLSGADPDGAIASYKVDWGDGKEDTYPGHASKAERKYDKDGKYTVRVRSVDDLGRQSPEEEIPVVFDHDAKTKAVADAKRLDEERVAQENAKKAAVEKHAHDEEEIKKVADAKSEKDKADRKERERKEQERLAEEKRKNDEEAQKSALATAGQGQPNALQPQAAQPQKSGAAPAPLSDFRDVATGRPVKPLRFDKPKYPRSALTAGVEGSVTVQFTVATNGLTNDLKVTSQTNGYYFRQAVMDSIRQARFQPAMIDGAPIEQAVAYQISFKLEK